MKPLIIPGTSNTPSIYLHAKESRFLITGASLPDNVLGFYEPVIEWIYEYFKEPNAVSHFEFKFTYINTASSKVISNILRIIDEFYNNGTKVSVTWRYDMDDSETRELGEDLSEVVSIPLKLLSDE
jgi:hypothetical protein